MPKVTAVVPERGDRVRVDLDGAVWRTLPVAAVASAGIHVGAELDRERARELRRALRRTKAFETAARALSHRDRPAALVDAALAQRGFAGHERAEAVEALQHYGYLDDRRFAMARAASLASRGYGDEAIRYDLAARGVKPEQIEPAVESLEPEVDRARSIAARSGAVAKTARSLAAKGFSADSVEAAIGFPDL